MPPAKRPDDAAPPGAAPPDAAVPDAAAPAAEADREARIRRLLWRARRGLLELDVCLQRLDPSVVRRLDEPRLATLEAFLRQEDPVLMAWFQGPAPEAASPESGLGYTWAQWIRRGCDAGNPPPAGTFAV